MLTICSAFLISSYIYSSNLYGILLIFMQVSCHLTRQKKSWFCRGFSSWLQIRQGIWGRIFKAGLNKWHTHIMRRIVLTLGSLGLGGGKSNTTRLSLRQSQTAMRASRGRHHALNTSMFPGKMMQNSNYYHYN